MTERYYSVDYEEQYYIFDSETISKDKVEEESEYGYNVFADSLSSKEIIDLLNENEQLQADLQMCREKGLYWQNKAKDIFGDMQTNVELKRDNKQLKSALKELKEIGDYKTNHIKELQEELQPIQDICKKYKINLEDLPDVLEEYITLDNEEYEEKLKERTI